MIPSSRYRAPFAPGGASPADAELCRRLLTIALESGGQHADVFFEYRASGGLSYEEGITRSASRGVRMGLGVRVLDGDAAGLAHTEDLSWEAMARAARTAGRIAAAGRTAEVRLPAGRALPERYEVAPSLDRSGLEKRELLQRASRAARAHDSRITKVEASFSEEVRELVVATSDGVWVHDAQPLFRFGVSVLAEGGGRRERGGSGGGGRTTLAYFDERSPEWHATRAAEQAVVLLDSRSAPAGELPVVLAPGDSGILLHEAVGHGLEADFNRKGTSNYAGRVGQPVASPLCTVVDDPTLVHGRGSLNVDDEGSDPVRSVLIEGGTLVGYLHDRLSSRHYGTGAAGNGRRESFSSAPLPRMTNTVLLAGPHDPEEIVRTVKRGIFARKFGGGQVDIANGDFVFSLTESYLIEDGRLTAPLKGVNLIGNGPETLSRVEMLGTDVELSDGVWTCGKDGQSVPVGVGCPTIKIGCITVGGTEIS